MRSIAAGWTRRIFGKRLHSLRNRFLNRNSKRKRSWLRRVLFESLENRQLMTASAWLDPIPELPDAGANAPVRFPWIGTGGNFFGPREKVWIDSVTPTVEGGEPGSIRIARSNAQPPLEVTFNILATSTAQKNIDYLEPKSIVVFEPGQSYVDVPIIAIDDAIPEATESVRFVLWDTSRIGTWTPPDIASLLISDNDQASRTTVLELLPPVDGHEGHQNGKLRARRSGSNELALQAPFEASFGSGLVDELDVRLNPKHWNSESQTGFFYFAAGESLASVSVQVLDDSEAENTEWMEIRLLPSSSGEYLLGGKPQQTLRVLDNDSRSGKRLVLVGDWAVLRPYRDFSAYFVSKGAIETLVRSMAVELASRNPNIHVNGILPGPVMLDPSISAARAEHILQTSLVKRHGRPEDVAQAAFFLSTQSFITGTCLSVDGGRTIYSPHDTDSVAHPTFKSP